MNLLRFTIHVSQLGKRNNCFTRKKNVSFTETIHVMVRFYFIPIEAFILSPYFELDNNR
jgi:hypothetical protein